MMTRSIASFIAILFSAAIFSNAQPAATADLTLEAGVAKHAGIDKIYSRFSEAYRTLNSEMVTNLYTDNAFYLSPGNDIQRGRATILGNFDGFFRNVKQSGGKMSIAFRILERRVSGDMAYDVGIYSLSSTNAKGETNIGRGKFVVVALRSENGDWKFQLDSYSDLPKGK
jgi:ketosteroid isomerase-like protein